jgi:hypothetical protein
LSATARFDETIGMARRRSTEEIQQVVEQYQNSGLTQIEYCQQTGMTLSTFGRYLRGSRRGAQHLVQVKLDARAEPDLGFVLTLGNGRRIASGWEFGEAELARLIRVAENA